MSLKIKVSYEREQEVEEVLKLLDPIVHLFKVKRSEGTSRYKHLYLVPRKKRKP